MRGLPRLRGSTVRLRLSMAYAALFLISGVVLLSITYGLVAGSGLSGLVDISGHLKDVSGDGESSGKPGGLASVLRQATIHGPLASYARQLVVDQRAATLHNLLLDSGIAVAIMTAAAAGLGWLMAGRVLRPVRQMTARARRISEENLALRLGIAGPADELKTLADTFDGLLGRLERSFAAQRQFAANVSHELRTPLTLQRAMVEVALADPQRSADTLGAACERVLAAGERQERLIEALLTLARGQRGLDRREPTDLAAVLGGVLDGGRAQADHAGLAVREALYPARTAGDPGLIERLAANLVDNAVRHNSGGGWIEVTTGTASGRAVLRVSNSGPCVAAEEVERLLLPFERSGQAGRDGHGLGLAIVSAISAAHGAELTLAPRREGGLDVTVGFPALADPVTARAARRDDRRGSAPPVHAAAADWPALPGRDPRRETAGTRAVWRAQRGHDLLRLGARNPRVVGALRDEHRDGDRARP